MNRIFLPKLLFLFVILLILITVRADLSSAASGPRTPDTPYPSVFFPFSVWYSGGDARAPMQSEITPDSREEWLRDLRQIRDLGFNTVRTWVEWQRVEPQPGVYNFDNLRLLMELAEEVGLRVFIQFYVDSAPDWVGKQNPDAKFKAQDGTLVESQSAPGFCTDHDAVRDAVLGFYTETARVANEYDNFYGWDLWSEPHIINWANIDYVANAQFCYCPSTQARFRVWLREKYGTLDALNTAWHRGFEEWEDVSPPRFSTILSYTDYLDWKTFIYEKLASDLRMRYDAVREGDPENVITSHAAVSSIIISPHMGVGATDDFLMAETVDYYGVSLYPKHNHPDRHWPAWRVMNMMDFARSANRNNEGWYVGELQAGKGTIALIVSDPVTPGDHRVWIWSAIAKGAKAVNIYAYYPMSSGYESGGYGLVNQDGSLTERAVRAGELAGIVDRNQELFLNSQPVPAEVAIVYNPLSQMVGGAQRRADHPMAHHNSLIGYYRVFAENNIPVDFIHRKELESGDLSQYKLVILPWSLMLTQQAADGLKQFVADGGFAVGEARIGWNDDRGYASMEIPGMGLHEVFGAREHEVYMRERDIPIVLTENDHPFWSRFVDPSELGSERRPAPNDTLIGTLYGKTVELISDRAEVIARLEMTGDPSIVVNRYGEGEALLAGSFLGMANFPETVPANNAFMEALADWAGVKRPVTTSLDGVSPDPVAARLQADNDGWLLFLINHGMEEAELSVSVMVDRDGSFRMVDLTRDERKSLTADERRIGFDTRIPGRDVQVWRIQAQ